MRLDARPELTNRVINMEEYDKLYIGYPNAEILDGLAVHGSHLDQADRQIQEWLKTIG